MASFGALTTRMGGRFAFAILLLFAAWFGQPAGAQTAPITTIGQVLRLSQAAASESPEVRLRAVITYNDAAAGILFIADRTGGIFLAGPKELRPLEAGRELLIEGFVQPGSRLSFVRARSFQILQKTNVPPPQMIDPKLVSSGDADAQWVELKGILRRTDPGLELDAGGNVIKLWVAAPRSAGDFTRLLPGAEIRVQGVGGLETQGEKIVSGVLFVPSYIAIAVEKEVPSDLFELPASMSAELPKLPSGSPVRIGGRVAGTTADGLAVVEDAKGPVRVRSARRLLLKTGDSVEAVGFLNLQSSIPLLEEGDLRLFHAKKSDGSKARILVTVREIELLPAEEAPNGVPVRLEGTVVYSEPRQQVLFLHDGDSSVFVASPRASNFVPGDIVDVEGVTERRAFNTIVRAATVTKTGTGRLPAAEVIPVENLIGGREEAQWMELKGVVQAVTVRDQRLRLLLASGDRQWEAVILNASTNTLPFSMVDSTVRIRGVSRSARNERRQWQGIRLLVNSFSDVNVEAQGPSDPFSAPVRAANELLRISRDAANYHRVLVRAVVTAQPSATRLYLHDSSGPILVEGQTGEKFQVGEVVEVAGFPGAGVEPHLRFPLIRRVGRGDVPVSALAVAHDALSAARSGELVQIRAKLTSAQDRQDHVALLFQDDAVHFEAHLSKDFGVIPANILEEGSRLQVTGLNRVEVNSEGVPTKFTLLLRSPNDVKLIASAPWWTAYRLRTALGATVGAIVLGGVWALTLRRKVQKQTEIIRARLNREAALENQLRRMVDSDLLGIIFWSGSGLITSSNNAFLQMTGCTRDQINNREISWRDLVSSDFRDLYERVMAGLMEPGQMRKFESELARRDGLKVPVLIGATLLDKEPLLGVAFVLDTSEQAKLAQQLRQVQKMETVGRLAGGVAHDFNNILTVIQGHCNLLLGGAPRDELDEESIREISQAAERASNLTRQLLMFSRKQVIQPQNLDLNQLVSALTRMLTRILGEDITLQCSYGPALPLIKADSGMMEQIIMNLAVNARDAMPQGGQLKIQTGMVRRLRNEIPAHSSAEPGMFVCLLVEDTGMGMDAETLTHIYEPFFTTKAVGKGTGLGLATVYGIVETHHGFIEVDTAIGQGTVFKVFIPASADKGTDSSMLPKKPVIRGGDETILLVEDEPALRALVKKALTKRGYRIIEAETGYDALGIWQQHRGEIDLLLTDVVMPKGVTGLELAKHLQKEDQSLKVIFSSGYSLDLFQDEQELVEGYNFVPKPYDPAKLAETVRARLDA